MQVEKICKQRILPALIAIFVMLCLSGVGVVWQYVDSYSSDSQNLQPSLSSAEKSFATGVGLWSWGGSPRGFSVNNGTLKYPDDYYTSYFNPGYGKSDFRSRVNVTENHHRNRIHRNHWAGNAYCIDCHRFSAAHVRDLIFHTARISFRT
jgi:hypothetical protein